MSKLTWHKGSATVILLVVLVVVVAGVLAYFTFLKKPGEVAVSPTPTPIKVAKTATPTLTVETANCKNTQYGLELTYPIAWKVWKPGAPEARLATCSEVLHIYAFAEDLLGTPFKNQINLQIDTRDNQSKEFWQGINSLDDYVTRMNLPIKKETKLNNERLVWLSLDSRFSPETDRLIAYHNSSIYMFSVYSVDSITLDQFLASFKFTK